MGIYTFTTLDGFPSGTYGAEAFGINDAGQIVGAYVDSSHLMHGYLYSNGTYTIIDDPLAGANGPYPLSGGSTGGTQAFGINDAGQIVGEYFDSSGTLRGFLYSDSTYITLDYPLSGGTYASSINDSGQIVGLYSPFGASGFLYSNGTYTTLPTYLSGYYQVTGINDAGQVVGMTYVGGLPHAFLYSNGTFTSLNDPVGTHGTAATAINDDGQIVGYYLDSSNVQHGFLYDNGIYTTIDNPLGTHGTVLTGISDAGQIVGYYLDSNNVGQIGGLISDYQSGVHYAFLATLGEPPSLETVLTFSGAVATFSQTEGNYDPLQMLDGDYSPNNGWAIYRGDGTANQTLSETALLTLGAPLAAGHYSFNFTFYQYHGNPGHSLGDFSLGYTTTASPTLTSVSTPFVITSATSENGTTFTFPEPGEILAGGPVPATDVYTITVDVSSADPITGIFLNVIDDSSNGFPTGGPGRYQNGNFTITELAASYTAYNLFPTITSHGAILVAENTTEVTTVTATDPDVGQTVSFAVVGGADATLFTIDTETGVLAFTDAPDFENRTDADHDNVYNVTVQVSDGNGGTDTQDIAVTVTNLTGIAPPASNAAVIVGTNEEDVLTGRGGANVLQGLGGDDVLAGGGGADTLNGGDGNDTLIGGTGKDSVNGDAGSDTINYTFGDGADTISGGSGSDTLNIIGTNTNNTLNMLYDGAVLTNFEGGAVIGIETINADLLAGVDTLTYAGTTADISVDLSMGSASGFTSIAGIENVTSGSGNDTLRGDGNANELKGGSGDDTYYADSGDRITESSGGGTDSVFTDSNTFSLSANVENLTFTGTGDFAGNGNGLANIITGGSGNDTINAGGGNDTIDAGAGNDILNGGTGPDTLDGGAGIDTASYASSTAAVTVDLNAGTGLGGDAQGDTLTNIENLIGSAFNDTLTGDTGNNVLTGGAGNDLLIGGAGDDTLGGGLGVDTASYATAGSGVTVSLAIAGSQDTVGAGIDALIGIERLVGSAFNDTLTGDSLANRIDGGAGDDTIEGGAGNDILIGGLNSAAGDTVSYASSAAGVTVSLAIQDGMTAQNTVGAGTDTLSGFEHLTGSAFNDILTGNGAANSIDGGAGNDIINGGAGNDNLQGGVGTDTLKGGVGNDMLTGGADADAFLFNTALNALTNVDNITDFEVGIDQIGLENSVFTKLAATGTLSADFFHVGAVAADPNDFIIYDDATGALYYDSNGSAAGQQVEFGHVQPGLALTHTDFFVV